MTTVTLLPNADLFSSGGYSGGSQPSSGEPGFVLGWQALTDGLSTTWIVLYEWRIGFATFTLPTNGIVSGAAITARAWNQGDNSPEDGSQPGGNTNFSVTALIQLRNAAGSQLCSWSVTFPGGGPTVRSVRSGARALLSADQATVDGLEVYMQSTSQYIGMDQLSLAITYASPPTVVVSTPTGTILTANPACAWTYTGDADADNAGSQTRYRVKAFTAAQYGAGGFDPETSTPTYDSGEVVTDVHNRTIGPFANLTTFKAYVKAAQNVSGSPQWGAWAAGPAFTTNTDPPVVLTLTAAVDTTLGAITLTAVRDTAHTNWTHVNMERSIDGGTTWQTVRGALQLPTTGNTMVVKDYEQPEGVPIRYRARGLVLSGTTVLSSGNFTTTAAPGVTWNVTGCGEYLRDPADPTHGVKIELIIDEETSTTEHRVGVLTVIGRASPVTVWDQPSLPTGEMRIATRTGAEATALLKLLRSAPVLLYQGRDELGHPYRWLVVTNHTASRRPVNNPDVMGWREWSVAYVEVDAPPVLS